MRLPATLLPLHVAVAMFFAATLLVAPIAVDQIHMDDTVLLAHIGWRGVNGLAPVIDYPHFYGGFAESFVTASFGLFGVSYKSIDYAFLGLFLFSAAITWALCFRRLPAAQTGLLVALAAALIISLDPIEVPGSYGVGHSFVYNHVGVALMLGLTIFASKGLEDRRTELVTAVIAGIALYVLLVTKTTFGLIGPAVILACLIQRRWLSAGSVLVGAAATMLVIDPGMTRALGSLDALLASEAANQAGGYQGRLLDALAMIQAQAVPAVIALIMALFLVQRTGPRHAPLLATLFLCGVAYGATMLATGGSPELKLLPFLVVTTLLLANALIEAPSPASSGLQHPLIIRSVPIVLAYALILPTIVTSADGLLQAIRYAEAPLVAEGPLSRYVVVDEGLGHMGEESLSAAIPNSLHRFRSGEFTERDEYVIFADGIELLRRLPGITSYGIISNGRMFDFTAPLRSKIVASHPVWPTVSSFSTSGPLGPDVDLVMMLDDIPELELVTAALHARMGEDFRLCRRSTFWALYARRRVPGEVCG